MNDWYFFLFIKNREDIIKYCKAFRLQYLFIHSIEFSASLEEKIHTGKDME
jgi:uncharacterized membrane protein